MSNRFHSTRRGVWTWQATGAICGLTFSLLAVLSGSLITASTWALGASSHPWLHGLGSVLLLLTIPSLIFGGLCYDRIDAQKKRQMKTVGDKPQPKKVRGHSDGKLTVTAIALLLLFGASVRQASAQQTVFNVPSTDALDRSKVYAELDASIKPYKSEDVPEFSSFVPRVVVGVGHHVEIGLNLTGNIQPGLDTTTLVPAVKWKFYDGKSNGWALAAGANFYFPARHRAYNMGNYSYLMMSKTFKKGTRLGAGGYFFSKNVVAPDANRAGGQFTFEQPVTKKLNVNADWFTGKHANGYFTAGAAYKLTNKLTGVAAYSIGNQKASKGNNFFYFELGYNFN